MAEELPTPEELAADAQEAERKIQERKYYESLFRKAVKSVHTNGITLEKTITFKDGSPEVKIPFMR